MRNGVDCKGKTWEEKRLYGRMVDATGKRFGKLVALFPVTCQNQSQWLCQCDCGNELVVPYNMLNCGNTQSCGCLQRERIAQHWQQFRTEHDVVGETFGELTVIQFLRTENGISWYRFQCSCGEYVDYPLQRVKSGNTNSCGHLWQDWNDSTKCDIIGQRFGKLVVRAYVGIGKYGETLFDCDCDCGNTTRLSRYSLTGRKTRSCGCIISIGESNIKKILNDADIKYKPQYSFPDLVSDIGGRLLYDFGILNDDGQLQRLIEFDGLQHMQAYEHFGGEERLVQQQKHDALKNQYALSHNIPLVRIPYDKRDSMVIDDLLGSKYLI